MFQFMQAALDIPEVGKVEVSWVANDGSALKATPAAGGASKSEQVVAEKEARTDAQANGDGDGGVGAARDADYDVAPDEDHWI